MKDSSEREVTNKMNDKTPQLITLEEIQNIVKVLPAINRTILEHSDDSVDLEEIGLLYEEEDYEQRGIFILKNIPHEESISSQAAYLLRAFTCSQLFLEGNKRTAIFLINFWIDRNRYHLETSDNQLWDFIKDLSMRCPRIPISMEEILVKDALSQHIEEWLNKRIV
jgi:prophage maintenance system killer protein